MHGRTNTLDEPPGFAKSDGPAVTLTRFTNANG